MKSWAEISASFKSTQVIVASVVSLIGAGIFIIGLIEKHDAKVIQKYNENKVQSSDHSVIKYLQHSDTLNTIWKSELSNRLNDISDSLNDNYTNTKKLTNNYIFFAKKNSATVDDFVNAVSGLEVVVVKSEDKSMDNPNFKMIIQKKKK
jgi:hypothetical protein